MPNNVHSLTLELRGASGGDGMDSTTVTGIGGNGARVITTISVIPNQNLFVYVGGKGSTRLSTSANVAGGYNGGSFGNEDGSRFGGGGGNIFLPNLNALCSFCNLKLFEGGASDIRTTVDDLSSRLAVAGGGGGGGGRTSYDSGSNCFGGYGGGLVGGQAYCTNMCSSVGKGGSQTAGGEAPTVSGSLATAGALGVGGGSSSAGGGGGGGYYGGSGGYKLGGGGGNIY